VVRLVVLFLLFIVSAPCRGQKNAAVSWKFSSALLPSGAFRVDVTADIKPGWHLYSQFIEEGGPVATKISFNPSEDFTLVGKTQEQGKASTFQDSIYEMEIIWYSTVVTFSQEVRLNKSPASVGGSIHYLLCDNHVCIPDVKEFSIDLSLSK